MAQMSSQSAIELATLLDGVDIVGQITGHDAASMTISKVSCDSRAADETSLFVAIKGSATDGHAFIDPAIKAGCKVVVYQENCFDPDASQYPSVIFIAVKNSRSAYARLATNFYRDPAAQLKMVGITGTNGKTTITYLLEEVLIGMGHTVGVIGTIEYRWFGDQWVKKSEPASMTTPDALELQRLLRKMADEGVEYVLMEVSSHALDQQRLGDIKFDTAVFTNLSHDHLDYHPSLEGYFEAKAALFTHHLKEQGGAVIFLPGKQLEGARGWAEKMVQLCQSRGLHPVIVGTDEGVDVQCTSRDFSLQGSEMQAIFQEEEYAIASPLVGGFNVDNIFTTLGITQTLGLDPKEVVPRLSVANGAPGRLQRVTIKKEIGANQPEVFVDYAHTPDALEKVLLALNELPHKNIFCVFGCGGDRDNAKRPVMGKIGANLATVSIVTSDNPRSEEPEQILDQIIEGVAVTHVEMQQPDWLLTRESGEQGCLVIEQRSEAIRTAVSAAGEGDIVLIAGKGHEKYQITPDGKRFFDDCLEAENGLLAWNSRRVESALSSRIIGPVVRWWSGRLTTDSRKVEYGDIFLALVGDTFDGHDYIGQAQERGAALAIISSHEKIPARSILPYCLVDDTLQALGDLAAFHRQGVVGRKALQVVGITGSCGKTTVKEMAASIFSHQWPSSIETPAERVLKTKGNFNNLIGLPLSLLPLSVQHETAILEMGMNRFGEIQRLATIAAPDISCITNVSGAHLEELGTVEGVAKAKRELFDTTKESGTLIINMDDPLLAECIGAYPHKKVTFSASKTSSSIDVRGADQFYHGPGYVGFTLIIGGEKEQINLQVPGPHNVLNALAAAAIAWSAGIPLKTIAGGLCSFRSVEKRSAITTMKNGLHLINDCYNANPASMAAGIETLTSMNGARKIAVLGDMLELGNVTEEQHLQLGKLVAEAGIEFLALYGSYSKYVEQGALENGMKRSSVQNFEDKQTLVSWLQQLLTRGDIERGDWMLVKGSRGMKMETIIENMEGHS